MATVELTERRHVDLGNDALAGPQESDDDETTTGGVITGGAGKNATSNEVDNSVVDRFFKNKTKLEFGQAMFIAAVPEEEIEQTLKEGVTVPSAGSKCIRWTLCAVAGIVPVFGWIALCARAKYVKNDEVSLATGADGSVYVLSRGCHLATTFCRQVDNFDLTSNVIVKNPVNLLRVMPGHYGLAKNNGEPVILMPGRHFINDPLFVWEKSVPMTSNYIRNATTHIITVPGGSLGLVHCLGVGHILEPGRHVIDNGDLEYKGLVKATSEYIRVLAKHRVMVPAGRLGLAWEGGDARLLASDQVYHIDSDLFTYAGSVDILDEYIEHGSIKIVTVNEGLLGIAFDDGQLTVMQPGRHIVDKSTFMFSAFLSTGQETLPIDQITSLSSDNVGLRFSAAFSIQVVDAAKAVTMLGRDLKQKKTSGGDQDLPFSTRVFQENLRDRARLALSIIIGNNKFTDSYLSTASVEGADDDDDDQGSFKGLVHDAFMEKFAKEMLLDCGVAVFDISIENIVIVSKQLSQALAQAAVKATELEMSRIDNDVEMCRAQTDMKSLKIRAEGRGAAKKIKAMAESQQIRILGQAQADRIAKIDDAMGKICSTSRQREMIISSAQTVGKAKSMLIFSDGGMSGDLLNGNLGNLIK